MLNLNIMSTRTDLRDGNDRDKSRFCMLLIDLSDLISVHYIIYCLRTASHNAMFDYQTKYILHCCQI